MISGFILKKGSMTSVFSADGKCTAVTRCLALPLTITAVDATNKTVQLAYGSKKRIDKAVEGFLKKAKVDIKPRHFKQFNVLSDEVLTIGSSISIDQVFSPGDKVSVTGTSKGRGFAGVIKRWGFKKQPIKNSSDRVRHPGSIGAQTPSKVVRGKKMPGHMGNATKTVTNLTVYAIDKDKNEIMIAGGVPGVINSTLVIKK